MSNAYHSCGIECMMLKSSGIVQNLLHLVWTFEKVQYKFQTITLFITD